MPTQTEILSLLVHSGKRMTPDHIGQYFCDWPSGPVPARYRPRVQILKQLGLLMRKKLVLPANRRGNMMAVAPLYEASDLGRALIQKGGRVTSGPNGKHTGPRAQRADCLRARFWNALRIKKKATVADIVEASRRESDGLAGVVVDNARHYLTALVRAGIATKMNLREPGYAPSSNGFIRFALVRDLGPLAPAAAANGVYDPNSRTLVPYSIEAAKISKRKARS